MHLVSSMRPKSSLIAVAARHPMARRAAVRMSAALPALPTGRAGSALALAARGGFAAASAEIPFKLSLAVLLSAFNALCWYAPLRWDRFTRSSTKLGVASTFSGGVFLALAFGHMVPESAAAFGGDAQAACLWTLGGYLLIWGVERFSHVSENKDSGREGSAAMLLGALSVHSMLETMALAVARSKSAASLLAGSIALHQPAESLALVVALLRAGLAGPRLVKLLLVFTAMGPAGAALGLGLQKWFGGAFGGALDGALIALTAGTFVYVGATEVVPEEFDEGGSRAKVLALVAGVVSILGLARAAEVLEAAAG
mmetsp:Transcript_7948/g.23693  ORF Transcript_7948/g.23693 Transcript_7948/m.23693 type:complete len:313 (+) Transcript_7948:125-1063(+)